MVVDVQEMKRQLLKYSLKGFDFKGAEFSPYRADIRFDVIGIKRAGKIVKIFEIKSCRQDFASDYKWQKYLPFATHFYFVAPQGVILPGELPKGIGLVEFYQNPNGFIGYRYTKLCRKREALSLDSYTRLIESVLFRLATENENLRLIARQKGLLSEMEMWGI